MNRMEEKELIEWAIYGAHQRDKWNVKEHKVTFTDCEYGGPPYVSINTTYSGQPDMDISELLQRIADEFFVTIEWYYHSDEDSGVCFWDDDEKFWPRLDMAELV
jgi:hypothetical protein